MLIMTVYVCDDNEHLFDDNINFCDEDLYFWDNDNHICNNDDNFSIFDDCLYMMFLFSLLMISLITKITYVVMMISVMMMTIFIRVGEEELEPNTELLELQASHIWFNKAAVPAIETT
jgi:hypothetical protein